MKTKILIVFCASFQIFNSMTCLKIPCWASTPRPTPSISPNLQNWCELNYFSILKQWQKKQTIADVSCLLSVDGNGQISNVRSLKKGTSSESDKDAATLLESLSPQKRLLWSRTKVLHNILVEFGKYPNVKLSDKDENILLPAWPVQELPTAISPQRRDLDLLNIAFDHLNYPLISNEKFWTVSCSFTLETNGRIGDIALYKSSGISQVDDAAIAAVSSQNPPFEKLLKDLQNSHQIIIEFYSNGEIRSKLKDNGMITLIGRSATVPDPKL